MMVTWIMGILIFVDDYLNIMTLSTCMKKLTDQRRVPREALSYIIDSTGAPVCHSAVLYLGNLLFRAIFTRPGIAELGYGTAIETFYHVIPFAFYAIAAVIIVPLFIVGVVPKLGRMRTAYRRLQETGKVYSPESAPLNEEDESEFQTQRRPHGLYPAGGRVDYLGNHFRRAVSGRGCCDCSVLCTLYSQRQNRLFQVL